MLADNFKTSQREGDERLCKKRKKKKDRKQNPTKRKRVKSSTLWGQSCKLALMWHDGDNGLAKPLWRRVEISFHLPGMGLCGRDECDLASSRQLGLTRRDEQLLGRLSSQVAPSISLAGALGGRLEKLGLVRFLGVCFQTVAEVTSGAATRINQSQPRRTATMLLFITVISTAARVKCPEDDLLGQRMQIMLARWGSARTH